MDNISTPKPQHKFLIKAAIAFFVLLLIFKIFVPPFGQVFNSPQGTVVEVKKGMGARQVAVLLKSNGIISSETLFVAVISVFGNENNISAGTYLFKTSVNIIDAAQTIVHGDFGFAAVKITIPEGFTVTQIADRLAHNLAFFKRDEFLALASTHNGYLYPETYFFLPSDSEQTIYKKMRDTFDQKTQSLQMDIASSGHSFDQIVTMASILEREVKSAEDKRIVSGILWNRIKRGMPLQVDATLAYERDKDSYTLTSTDLKQDSPYNTYTRKGLPPTPISNPGFDALFAAVHPEESTYVYFLTDRDGNVYYATTYAEHLQNKAKYMK